MTMNFKLVLFTLCIIAVVACKTSRKNSTSIAKTEVSATTNPTVAASPSTTVIKPSKSANGIYEPGEEELIAVQSQYKDVTLDQLKKGYIIYSMSACVSCHTAQNIYAYSENNWTFILEDMCYKAKLDASQKAAVTRYVFAIKAASPNKKQ